MRTPSASDVVEVVDEVEPITRRVPRFGRGTDKQLMADARAFDADASPDATFLVGNSDQITRVNPAGELLTGYPRSELLGCPLDLLLPDHARKLRTGLTVMDLRGRTSCENLAVEVLQCRNDDGGRVLVLRPCKPEHDYLREETIAGIVHDLKTPLSTVLLEVGLLGARFGAAHAGPIDRIEQNVMYMDRLIRDLLDAAAIADGHFAIRAHPTELRSLVGEVIARVVATRDRGRVVLEVPESILASVDDVRIERVIANLVTNALKYSPGDSVVRVGLARRGASARLSVDDAGPGLTADEALYIFDKYRRIASSTRQDGVGLGLYVSRKIIEEHGGRLGVESSGNGSRFYFEIPTL
jgi:PAS domain S-box-containing protein